MSSYDYRVFVYISSAKPFNTIYLNNIIHISSKLKTWILKYINLKYQLITYIYLSQKLFQIIQKIHKKNKQLSSLFRIAMTVNRDYQCRISKFSKIIFHSYLWEKILWGVLFNIAVLYRVRRDDDNTYWTWTIYEIYYTR